MQWGKLIPRGTEGDHRFCPSGGGLDNANCEPALQPDEVCLAHFPGQESIRYGNTTRSATLRGVHLERRDRNSLIFMCVANTRRRPSHGSKNWSHGNSRRGLSNEQALTAVSLCSGCSLAVESPKAISLCSGCSIAVERILDQFH